MTRRVSAIVLPLLLAFMAGGCNMQHASTPTSPTTTTTTTTTTTSSSYVGTWASATSTGSVASTQCGNVQWRIANQTATSIAGDFSAQCGALSISGTGAGTLNGQDVRLQVSGNVTGMGFQLCSFNLTGTGTIQNDTLPLSYSGTTCLGNVSGTETLKRGFPTGPVVINAPTPVSPSGAVGSTQPTLTVTNATKSGTSASLVYAFQITQDVSFASNVLSWQVPEGSGQTSLTVPQALSGGATYYWRARASDGTNTGSWSSISTITTPSGGAPPPGGGGDHLDMGAATIVNSPWDLAGWPVTTNLEVVDMGPGGISVQFSRKDGPGRWPDVTPPGWDGALQYTLGMCLSINGRWYCSAVVEYWYGLDRSGGPPQDYAMNWFYDPIRWAPMTGHQPAPGETIGIFVCAGDCRNNKGGSLSPVKERSNVVLVKMPGPGGAYYRF